MSPQQPSPILHGLPKRHRAPPSSEALRQGRRPALSDAAFAIDGDMLTIKWLSMN